MEDGEIVEECQLPGAEEHPFWATDPLGQEKRGRESFCKVLLDNIVIM